MCGMCTYISAQTVPTVQEVRLFFAIPAALRNAAASGTCKDHHSLNPDDDTIEVLLLNENAQGHWITLEKADENRGLPPGTLRACFHGRNATGSTPVQKDRRLGLE